MKIKVVVVGILVVGMVISVWDYRNWRIIERGNYGHGPTEGVALQLTQIYQNDVSGVRIRHPETWRVVEGAKFKTVKDSKKAKVWAWDQLVGSGERELVAKLGNVVSVEIGKDARNITDIADEEVKKLESVGASMGDREYINNERSSITVLKWEDEIGAHIVGLAPQGSKLVIVSLIASKNDIAGYEPTFKEMLRSLVLI